MSVVYKCKMCGGDITPNADGKTGKCQYCGALQTLPKEQNDKLQNLLNRANDFRLNSNFDRAIYEYEQMLDLDETEPEAHWGLFLSRYGVEYVKDRMTATYKPTLHRISSVSVFDDVDYQATQKYAPTESAGKYKQDAEDIESVMKELLILSANQEPYDIFLSYKEADDVTRQRTDDSYLAHDLYNELTARGYKIFFAPKSLGVGLYEPKIYAAIISSSVMIVLGTKDEYFNAVWVKNEWSRFAELIDNGEKKTLIPVFKNMQATDLPSKLAKFQAYDMADISFLERLKDSIAQSVNKSGRIGFKKDVSAEDNFIERGLLALEDRNFSQATVFFESALNLNAHNSEAYFGKLMVEMQITKQEQMLTSPKPLKEYVNFERAVKFADPQLKAELLRMERMVQDTLNKQKYSSLIKEINDSNPPEKWDELSEAFKSISGCEDADEKAAECHEKAEELRREEEARRLKAEKSKMRVKRTKAIIALAVIAGIVFLVLLKTEIVPAKVKKDNYNKAIQYMENKDYRSAYSAFNDLGDYKDSSYKAKELERLKPILKFTKVSNVVTFGKYEWQVLAVEDNRALIITKDCVAERAYNTTVKSITWKWWESCSLRSYLNGTWYNSAFNDNEKAKIRTTNVVNPYNSWYGTEGENDTKDKVFLLSGDEANEYFSSDNDRIAKYNGKAVVWWLRTSANSGDSLYVDTDGYVYYSYYSVNDTSVGVRPALWINLKF